MDDTLRTRSIEDTRRRSRGVGQVHVVVHAVFGLVVLVPALVSLVRDPGRAPLADALGALAGLGYVVLAVCMAHNGRRMRRLGWAALALEAVGLVTVSLLVSLRPADGELGSTAWAHWGQTYWFAPAIMPVIGVVWMWLTNPRRIVVNAERISDLSGSIQTSVRRDR